MALNPGLIQAGVGAASTIGQQYAEAFQDFSQEPAPIDTSSGRVDITTLGQQEFQGPNKFNPMAAAQSGLVGIGAEIIKQARSRKAEKEFEQQKMQQMKAAVAGNLGYDFRRQRMRNLGQSSSTQMDRFLRTLL